MKRGQRRKRDRQAERTRLGTAVVAAAIVVVAFGNAEASTSVHFDPGQVIVNPGQEFDLSFRVAESPDSIASFQLYLSFDSDVIELTDAVEGSLYSESGFMTWFIEEEHGYKALQAPSLPTAGHSPPMSMMLAAVLAGLGWQGKNTNLITEL